MATPASPAALPALAHRRPRRSLRGAARTASAARASVLYPVLGGALLAGCAASKATPTAGFSVQAGAMTSAYLRDPEARLANGTFANAESGVKVDLGGFGRAFDLTGDGLDEFVQEFVVSSSKDPSTPPRSVLAVYMGLRTSKDETRQIGGASLCPGETIRTVTAAGGDRLAVATSNRSFELVVVAGKDRLATGTVAVPPLAPCIATPAAPVAPAGNVVGAATTAPPATPESGATSDTGPSDTGVLSDTATPDAAVSDTTSG